jgi:hypothetical protein
MTLRVNWVSLTFSIGFHLKFLSRGAQLNNLMALTEQLRSLVAFVGDPLEIADYEADSADVTIPRMHRVSVSDVSLQSLVEILRSIPILCDLEGGIAHHSPSSSSSISLNSIAHWLLARARVSPPDECVDSLMEAVSKNQSPLLEIIPVWGISPRVSIDLGEKLKIIPIHDLPPSKLKDLFTGKKRHRFSFDIANSSPRPGAAIVKETVDGPLYESSTSEAAIANKRQSELMLNALIAPSETGKQAALAELAKMMDPLEAARESTSIYDDAEEVATVVALCTSRPIFLLGQWYQRPIDLPLVGTLGGYCGPTNDHPFYIAIDQQDYPVTEIEALIKRYRVLDEQTRKRLRTPLNRLNQGRRHRAHHTVEAAVIDLGIAAEALLTQDRDKDAPISFTLRARGTLLLGGSPEERRKNYETLKTLYDLRSKVAHEGSIVDRANIPHSERDRGRLRDASNILQSGEETCKALIRKVIEEGRFPSWDALMFGW